MAHFNNELRAQENCGLSTINKSVHNDFHKKRGYYTTSGLFSLTNKVA